MFLKRAGFWLILMGVYLIGMTVTNFRFKEFHCYFTAWYFLAALCFVVVNTRQLIIIRRKIKALKKKIEEAKLRNFILETVGDILREVLKDTEKKKEKK